MKTCVALLALVASTVGFARADEIEFTTLPQPIQSIVIRETHIPSASYVTGVVRQQGGIYAVTVRQSDDATKVVYVNDAGTIVQAPGSTVTTTTTTTEPQEEQVITYEQMQQNLPRYELVEKKGNKEIYLDRQTGQKVKVERED
jgi:hypothetical protein